jgi:hypothetical protein
VIIKEVIIKEVIIPASLNPKPQSHKALNPKP